MHKKKELPAPGPAPATRTWRNRIVEHAVVDPKTLAANPRNWRAHPEAQKKALAGVLAEVGWVQDVIVNKTTGYIVDGHARVALAITASEQVPVKYVELTEEEEALVLASLDPITGMAIADETLLRPLLEQAKTDSVELKALLGSMLDAAVLTQIQDADAEETTKSRDLMHSMSTDSTLVKAVFTVDELRTVERAIRAVENPNRGAALLTICREYLENHGEPGSQ